MKSLSFKTLLVGFILAIGILVVSPFTPESTADSYSLYVVLTRVKCYDYSESLDTLCYSYTETNWWTAPPNHGNEHSPDVFYTSVGSPKNYYTDSCYTGCSD